MRQIHSLKVILQDKAFERRFVIVELSEPTEVTQNSGRRGGLERLE